MLDNLLMMRRHSSMGLKIAALRLRYANSIERKLYVQHRLGTMKQDQENVIQYVERIMDERREETKLCK